MKTARIVSKGQAFLHQAQSNLLPRKLKADRAKHSKNKGDNKQPIGKQHTDNQSEGEKSSCPLLCFSLVFPMFCCLQLSW